MPMPRRHAKLPSNSSNTETLTCFRLCSHFGPWPALASAPSHFPVKTEQRFLATSHMHISEKIILMYTARKTASSKGGHANASERKTVSERRPTQGQSGGQAS